MLPTPLFLLRMGSAGSVHRLPSQDKSDGKKKKKLFGGLESAEAGGAPAAHED